MKIWNLNINSTIKLSFTILTLLLLAVSLMGVWSVSQTHDYNDGGDVQYATIQYLNQRDQYEEEWLDNLKNSNIPATIIWERRMR